MDKKSVLWVTGTPGAGKTTFARQLGLSTFSTDDFVKAKYEVLRGIGHWIRKLTPEEQEKYIEDFFAAYNGEAIIEGWVPSHILNKIVSKFETEMMTRVWVTFRN